LEEKLIKDLKGLFYQWAGVQPSEMAPLPGSGSNRKYFRLKAGHNSIIGTYNTDIRENEAFISFSRALKHAGLPVPGVHGVSQDRTTYLQDDLGDITLFNYLTEKRKQGIFPQSVIETYKEVLAYLPKIQVESLQYLDLSKCYPRAAFDRQSMMWDLNYFKYYFLKLARIPFDEQKLEDDFRGFCDFLLSADHDYFMYRDFQSRNIMIENDQVFFIDYQGGRKGPPQYDVASLLYDAKANIPEEIREELLDYYLTQVDAFTSIDDRIFRRHYYGYVLIRIMQALGAYGFRGFYERKTHFLQSIPYALTNLKHILKKVSGNFEGPHLMTVLEQLPEAPALQKYQQAFPSAHQLTVTIQSFSYKLGLPEDYTGNGGGFIFDCRCIHNPGRYEEYKALTGLDQPVRDFLKADGEIDEFLSNAIQLVEQSVEKYLNRGFDNLQVNFGCTGGQHRSVYCADQLSRHLKQRFTQKLKVIINHREQNIHATL